MTSSRRRSDQSADAEPPTGGGFGKTSPTAHVPADETGAPPGEALLDDALRETFPASDPIAPGASAAEQAAQEGAEEGAEQTAEQTAEPAGETAAAPPAAGSARSLFLRGTRWRRQSTVSPSARPPWARVLLSRTLHRGHDRRRRITFIG
jgi:hypothetical protein